MKHIDLFSGIGGFSLASDRVFGEVEHIFCDIEPFSQEILKKHWPNSKIYGDIRTLTADAERERQLQPQGSESKKRERIGDYYILTGGFPCQPFSQAGKRRGTEDDRHLWPEMLRVIREFHPRWIIGENVGGLVTWNGGMVLEQIQSELEAEGYEVQAFIIPAAGVNAPHRRDRVWVVAHSKNERMERRRSGRQQKPSEHGKKTLSRCGSEGFDKSWLEVATRVCRVDDGLPKRLDRTPRLKALGNAIVPQVAEEIMRVIKDVVSSLDH